MSHKRWYINDIQRNADAVESYTSTKSDSPYKLKRANLTVQLQNQLDEMKRYLATSVI